MIEHLSRIAGDGAAAVITISRLPDMWDVAFGIYGAGLSYIVGWAIFQLW